MIKLWLLSATRNRKMAMKILGGYASGIPLTTPKTKDVRPTGVRAKKALFDSLNSSFGFAGKTVVDLFSGTGGLGLEAASRGAERVFLVEKAPLHCKLAAENIEKIKKAGVETKIEVIHGDSLSAPSRLMHISGNIDLIFADPPYAKFAYFYNKFLTDARFAEWAKGAMVIWEQPPNFRAHEITDNSLWQTGNIRKFAQTSFNIWQSHS